MFIYVIIIFIALLVLTVMINNHFVQEIDFTPMYKSNLFSNINLNSTQIIDKIKDNQILKYNYNNNYKIALISLSVGSGRKFAEASKQRLQQYADIHGYTLEYFNKNIDKNYGPMWQKVLAVKEVLNKNIYDYVVWIDDDIYITNTSFKIEDFINLTNKPIIMSRDRFINDVDLYINSGIYILKTNKISKQFIQDTIDNYNLMKGYFKYRPLHEQSVMTYLFLKEYYNDIEVLPFNTLQSFKQLGISKFYSWLSSDKIEIRDWKEGDFIMHYAGVNKEKRNVLMPKMIGKDILIKLNDKEYPITRQNWEIYN